jgi:hypothetical protein
MNQEEPKGRVFIPQEPVRFDAATRTTVSIMNFNHARKFGEPVVMLGSGPMALNTAPTIWMLKEALRDFCDDDYLIAVGDPTLQAMAAIIAAENNRGRVNFLKWDRSLGRYLKVEFNLHHRMGDR